MRSWYWVKYNLNPWLILWHTLYTDEISADWHVLGTLFMCSIFMVWKVVCMKSCDPLLISLCICPSNWSKSNIALCQLSIWEFLWGGLSMSFSIWAWGVWVSSSLLANVTFVHLVKWTCKMTQIQVWGVFKWKKTSSRIVFCQCGGLKVFL